MKSAFQPRLVNGPFGDPGLLVGVRWQGYSLLFDLGRIDRLPAGEVLKVRYAFVSHAHMDHFIGFDHLLRLFLARDRTLDLFGPEGIAGHVMGKLRGYAWNLVEGYPFVLRVHEIGRAEVRTIEMPASAAFTPSGGGDRDFDGTLLEATGFKVKAVHLDHRIDSLGFALEEELHLNVRSDDLERIGIPAGPWLNRLKAAIRAGAPDDGEFEVEWREDGALRRQAFRLGELRRRLIVETPGQKLVYVTDLVFSASNVSRVEELARGADVLYCESLFMDEDRDEAIKRYHLTARQAGTLARRAGAKRLEVFHFSPRYDDAGRLYAEAEAAFAGRIPPDEPL